MADSKQKVIERNRAPRVQIAYDVEHYGSPTTIELPFVMGVMADLSGASETPEAKKPIGERNFVETDAGRFNKFMEALAPRVKARVRNTLPADEGETADEEMFVDLSFRSMSDFAPDKVAEQAFASKTTDIAALMEGELENAREQLVQKIGENISVRRAALVEAPAGGTVGGYVHGGRIAALTVLSGGTAEAAKDVSMHVAAINPVVALPENMPQEQLDKEKAIILAQPDMAGKPENIAEKMVQGRLKKYLAENSLTEQAFVKNPDQTVAEFVKAAGGEVVSFTRFEVGEGIEKEEVDFAKEVMEQAGRS